MRPSQGMGGGVIIFGTLIKVIAGFYLGCTGTVLGINEGLFYDDYYVSLNCSEGWTIKTTLPRKTLEVIKVPEAPK